MLKLKSAWFTVQAGRGRTRSEGLKDLWNYWKKETESTDEKTARGKFSAVSSQGVILDLDLGQRGWKHWLLMA